MTRTTFKPGSKGGPRRSRRLTRAASSAPPTWRYPIRSQAVARAGSADGTTPSAPSSKSGSGEWAEGETAIRLHAQMMYCPRCGAYVEPSSHCRACEVNRAHFPRLDRERLGRFLDWLKPLLHIWWISALDQLCLRHRRHHARSHPRGPRSNRHDGGVVLRARPSRRHQAYRRSNWEKASLVGGGQGATLHSRADAQST